MPPNRLRFTKATGNLLPICSHRTTATQRIIKSSSHYELITYDRIQILIGSVTPCRILACKLCADRTRDAIRRGPFSEGEESSRGSGNRETAAVASSSL